MLTTFVLAATAASMTTYPGYLRQHPAGAGATARVEAIVHRGPISELIVRCPRGTAIISYSKMERLYCIPRGGCGASLDEAVRRACR